MTSLGPACREDYKRYLVWGRQEHTQKLDLAVKSAERGHEKMGGKRLTSQQRSPPLIPATRPTTLTSILGKYPVP